ncbi:MAG: D-(-)-3-hydroxybutyrate oligomer hydrolase [Nitrospirae bacterium]|nr:D-(-)-3-hydroxybutyrate oligomer hydrolase [Nitrospirota bacterium]
MHTVKSSSVVAAVLFSLLLTSYASGNANPPFIKGEIVSNTYDGGTDDLLTAGLGKTGLQGAAPVFADPLNPTAAELRRRAIYTNYRALVDPTAGGGYGVLYGPNIDLNGGNTLGEGKIAGEEHLAFAGDASGKENVVLMVQIPASFNAADPCIVTAPSSGSRGVYGAIGTAGDWGLKRGCAVAYTDKGTGTGAHDLQNGKVNLITGEVESADVAGKNSHFTAKASPAQLAAFNAATPNRFAFKHAHSEQNPEQDWGRDVLQSIEFAFFLLNNKFGETSPITPENTIVIASSVSNGGGASIRAAEQDKRGLIDGVAVSEPNVNPEPGAPFVIVQGSGAPFADHSKSLLDYTTLVNVFQPCASVALGAGAPLNFALSPNRCQSLKEKGLLQADTLAAQAAEAQAIINAYGILPEQNVVQPSHAFAFVPQSISVTYANAYGRFGVIDNLCSYSFGATSATGNPIPLAPASLAAIFSVSNGIPPTGGVNLINNLSMGGPREDRVSVSASTGRQDQNVDGALCLRALAIGVDPATGQTLTEQARANHVKILSGIDKIRASGDVRGKPTVIVTGRNDAILPPNHTSRAYYGLNQLAEGAGSQVRYYEVLNAHHLDAFNAFDGFNDKFVPLHRYFIQALNLIYAHLKNGTPLPPSQVVRTIPRGAGAPIPAITLANVPPISATPVPGDLITFDGATLHIPD